MFRTKTVQMTRVLDLSPIPEFFNQGDPDVTLDLGFHAPNLTCEVRYKVWAHRKVLAEASPIFKEWLDDLTEVAQNGGNPGLLTLKRDIENEDRDSDGFKELLVFFYTKKLTPLNLVQVFGYAMQFGVELSLEDFTTALCCRNTLRLLDKFQMTSESQKVYRQLTLNKIQAKPLEIISSTYFPFMKATTLEEVLGRLIRKVAKEELLTALLGWAKSECARQGKPTTVQNFIKVFPVPVVCDCDSNGMDVEANFTRMVSDESGSESSPIPTTSRKRPSEDEARNTPLEKKQRVEIKVNVSSIQGWKESFQVSPTDKLMALKKLIMDRKAITMDLAYLSFGGKRLDDNKTFEELHIQDGAHIQHFLQLRGC